MNYTLILLVVLTCIINFILIISLSVRIVSTRTKRISTSNSLFSLIYLIGQFSYNIQIPILAKYVEELLVSNVELSSIFFRIILLASTFGAILGAISIPTIHRFMSRGVELLHHNHSVINLIKKSISISTVIHLKNSAKWPDKLNFVRLKNMEKMNVEIFILNILVYTFMSTSMLSCLYAGALHPELRTTSLSLSGFAGGIGTIIMLLLVEPYNSILTDKVIEEKVSNAYFRQHLSFVILARIIGTLMSQFLFIPLSKMIVWVAAWI
ncbi:lipid II flippase family protein [Aquirufa aurantiipilula]